MIDIEINGAKFPIAQSFSDFTTAHYARYVESVEQLPIERLSVACNAPVSLLNELSFTTLAWLMDTLSFLDEQGLMVMQDPYDVGGDQWGTFEGARQMARGCDNVFDMAVAIAKVYTGTDFTNVPALEGFPTIMRYYTGFMKFCEQFQELNNYQPSQEMELAGIDRLERFGFMCMLIPYHAKYGQGKTHDEILAYPAITIYTTLLHDYTVNDIQNRVREYENMKKKS